MIDFSLSDEQKAYQKTARDFARKEIAPVALQYDKEPAFPGEIIKKAKGWSSDEKNDRRGDPPDVHRLLCRARAYCRAVVFARPWR